MILEAYSPLGTGKIFDVPEMKQIQDDRTSRFTLVVATRIPSSS